MNEYCGEYVHDGQRWALNIFADNEEDAEKRAEEIRASFTVLGRLECVIPFGNEQDTTLPKIIENQT